MHHFSLTKDNNYVWLQHNHNLKCIHLVITLQSYINIVVCKQSMTHASLFCLPSYVSCVNKCIIYVIRKFSYLTLGNPFRRRKLTWNINNNISHEVYFLYSFTNNIYAYCCCWKISYILSPQIVTMFSTIYQQVIAHGVAIYGIYEINLHESELLRQTHIVFPCI